MPKLMAPIRDPTIEHVISCAPQLTLDEALDIVEKSRNVGAYFYGPGTLFRGVVSRYCVRFVNGHGVLYRTGSRWLDRLPGNGSSDYLLLPTSSDYAAAVAADAVSNAIRQVPQYELLASLALTDSDGSVVDTAYAAVTRTWSNIEQTASAAPLCESFDADICCIVSDEYARNELDFDMSRVYLVFCSDCGGWIHGDQCRVCFKKYGVVLMSELSEMALPRKAAEYFSRNYKFKQDPRRARAVQLRGWADAVLSVAPGNDTNYWKPLRNIEMESS